MGVFLSFIVGDVCVYVTHTCVTPLADDCVRPKDAMLPAMYFLGAVFAVAVGTTVFFKGKLKRREYEEEHPDM